MSDHIQQTIRTLEQEIAALDQRRGDLVRAIDALRPLAGEVVATPPATHNGNGRSARGGPTDERILAVLRERGPILPSALAKAVKLERSTLAVHLKQLTKTGLVEITGSTRNRQVSLPRKTAAKEAP